MANSIDRTGKDYKYRRVTGAPRKKVINKFFYKTGKRDDFMQLTTTGAKAFTGISTSVAKKAVITKKATQGPKDSVFLSKGHSDDGEMMKMKKLQDMKRAATASSSKSEKPGKGKDTGEAKETEKKSEEKKISPLEQMYIDRAKNQQKMYEQWEKYINS